MLSRLVVSASIFATGGAVSLPSIPATSPEVSKIQQESKWWVRFGGSYFHSPPASLLSLSSDVSDYYYSVGDISAMSPELRARRVGGDGQWHIFHLPEGVNSSLMQVNTSGTRRASASKLNKLTATLQQGHTEYPFPPLKLEENYEDSLTKQVRGMLDTLFDDNKVTSQEVWMGYEKQIVDNDGQGTRSHSNKAATNSVLQFLQEDLKKLGIHSCLHELPKYKNVVGFIPGKTRQTLTVGAHYDSRPYEGPAPGAVDNGSGVASLLTTAKALTALKAKGWEPERDIYIAFFANEEGGLVGSNAFAEDLLAKGFGDEIFKESGDDVGNTCAMGSAKTDPSNHQAIIFDEVGWQSPKAGPAVNLEGSDEGGADMRRLGSHLLQSKMPNGPAVIHSNNPFGSDHMSFIDKGCQALLIIMAFDDQYPAYHKSSDTIEKVSKGYATDITKMAIGGVLRASMVTSDASGNPKGSKTVFMASMHVDIQPHVVVAA